MTLQCICTAPHRSHRKSEIWNMVVSIRSQLQSYRNTHRTPDDMRIIVYNVKVNGKLYCHTDLRWPNRTNERCITFHFSLCIVWTTWDWERIKGLNISHLVNSSIIWFRCMAFHFVCFLEEYFLKSKSINAAHCTTGRDICTRVYVKNVIEIASRERQIVRVIQPWMLKMCGLSICFGDAYRIFVCLCICDVKTTHEFISIFDIFINHPQILWQFYAFSIKMYEAFKQHHKRKVI